MRTKIFIGVVLPAALAAGLAVEETAAQNPVPAPPQEKSVLITGAAAHLGDGKVLANAAIGFRKGKFDLVAEASLIRLREGAYDTVIDATGKHLYPGLIALNTVIGLSELELVRATRDFHETGSLNAPVRSLIAYDTDSKVIPTVRSNGVLLAEVVPQGGLVSGMSSVMMLDGWNWEDAVYRADVGIHLNWPNMNVTSSGDAAKEKEQRQKIAKELVAVRQLFDDARAYSLAKRPPEINLSLEAMMGLFDGTRKLFVHAQFSKQIVSAVMFCKEYGIRCVIVGGRDAWRLTDLLVEQGVAVVLQRTHALPLRHDEDIDLPYKLPFLLKKAGVEFCTSVEGFWQTRNLSYNAGTNAAYGLTREEALESVTLAPARILGIDELTGSLAEGKDASLLVVEGDLLDMRTSTVETAFLKGRHIDLDNMQKQLFERYKSKYGMD